MNKAKVPSPESIVGGIDAGTHHALAGDAFLAEGKNTEAQARYAAAVECDPNNARFHWLLGVAEDKLGMGISAMGNFQCAARLDPKSAFAHASMGAWFLNNGMIELALESSAKALELMPGNHSIMQMRARALEISGQSEAAWKMVLELLTAGYAPPLTLMLYARLAKRHGQGPQALVILDRRLAAGKLSAEDAAGLHFAAANLLDSMSLYDQAFTHARMANNLLKPKYSMAEHERTFDEFINYFTRDRLAKIPRASVPDQIPVFIVGMPRSGTSLVEQIIASHPQAHGAGELDFMYQVWSGAISMAGARTQDYPQCLDRLMQEQIDGLAQVYLQPLRAMNPSALRITDKLPLNFLHLGLISIVFPEARIIHCRRDPMDTCLSCYMTPFREGHMFKYDLTAMGHFYRQYARLMDHCKANFDLPMLEVQYEELVANPESQSRRIIEFIGLPWNDQCLHFDRTVRPVATASLHQVRQPIYRTATQRWRHYEKYLGELKQSLGAALVKE